MPQWFSQLALLIFSPILWHDVQAPRARARSPPDEILLHPNLDTKKEKAFEKRVHHPEMHSEVHRVGMGFAHPNYIRGCSCRK